MLAENTVISKTTRSARRAVDGTQATYLVEVKSAPFRRVFARVSVEDGEETLSAHAGEVEDERMRVLHRAALALLVRDADGEEAVLAGRFLVQVLGRLNDDAGSRSVRSAHSVGISAGGGGGRFGVGIAVVGSRVIHGLRWVAGGWRRFRLRPGVAAMPPVKYTADSVEQQLRGSRRSGALHWRSIGCFCSHQARRGASSPRVSPRAMNLRHPLSALQLACQLISLSENNLLFDKRTNNVTRIAMQHSNGPVNQTTRFSTGMG